MIAQLSDNPTQELCNYGCFTIAQFQFKSGKWCCHSNVNQCLGKRKQDSEKKKGKKGHSKGHKGWNKGLTKETDSRVKCGSEKVALSVQAYYQKNRHPMLGKTYPGKNLGGYRAGGGRSKKGWYYSDKNGTMFLQSSWEFCLASRFDDWDIPYIHITDAKAVWIDSNGTQRMYIPDFYLPRLNLYVDPKSYVSNETNLKLRQAFTQINLTVLLYKQMIEVLQATSFEEASVILQSLKNVGYWEHASVSQ